MRSGVDWERVKAEYISGDDNITHQSLANKYGVVRTTVSRRAMKGWDDARKQYRHTVATKMLNNTSTTEADLRAKQLRVCDALLAKGLTALQNLAPITYIETLRTLETAMDQARKAAGITEGDRPQSVNLDIPTRALKEYLDDLLAWQKEKAVAPSEKV